MKKVTLLFSIFSTCFISSAQQDPIFSAEGHNTFAHNPASFGNMEYWSVNVLGRLQWPSLSSSPKYLLVNGGIEIPIGGKLKKVRNFGLTLGSNYGYDEIGFQRNHKWNLAIGIPFYITRQTHLTVAIAPGLYSVQFAPDWVPPQTGNDTLLPASTRGTAFDLDAGLMFNWKSLYAGFSVTHITTPLLSDINFSLARHYHVQFGYKIPINKHFIFPMAQFKADGAGFVAQAMTYFVFKDDLFSVGAGYRFNNSYLGGASFQLKGFRLGYNYEYTIGPLAGFSGGSHELRLSYIFQPKTGCETCPTWD